MWMNSIENSGNAEGRIFPTFEEVLDESCSRLQTTRTRYSIRRLGELAITLDGLEQDLDAFLQTRPFT